MTSSFFTAEKEKLLLEHYGITEDYRERIRVVQSIVPSDVKTLLDIGCGKGEIANSLACEEKRNLRIVGTDLSKVALTHLRVPAVLCGLPHLPFRTATFDLVLCLQVLEHLPASIYAPAFREIARVARSYLIIGVPLEENLLTKRVYCSNCGNIFHADGHLRRYRESDLKVLFPGFTLVRTVRTGVLQRRRSRLGVWLEHHVGGGYYQPELAYCPRCGQNSPGNRRPFRIFSARRISRKISDYLSSFGEEKPYWIIGYYQRTDGRK